MKYNASLDNVLRMQRIGSDILPFYSHEDISWFYADKDVKDFLEKNLKQIGDFAKNHNIRLSFHPGQYCVLSSDKEEVIINSIKEFEYHTDVARMLGYTSWHENGFAINVHVGSRKGGIEKLKQTIPKLSKESKNLITIENDENSFGLDDVLELSNICSIVLDVHHQWVYNGEFIDPNDNRFKKVIESWKDVRPKIHYSLSRENITDCNTLPNLEKLLECGHKKQKLRAHSDMCWNNKLNNMVLKFLPYADIMVEAKMKNLASSQLYNYYKGTHNE